jgi:hypothetical protein
MTALFDHAQPRPSPLAWLRRLGVGLGVAWCCAVAQAQTDPATAEQMLRKSGLWDQMVAVAASLREGFASRTEDLGARVSPSEMARMQALAEQAYQTARMQDTARALAARQLSPADLPALNAWYDSPLGQRINGLEAASVGGSAEDRRARDLAGADQFQTLSTPRKLLLRDLVIAVRALDMNVSLVQGSTWALYQGMRSSTATPVPGLPSEDEVRARLAAERPGLRMALAPMLLSSMTQVYADLSDEELGRYVDFLKSPSGRAYTDLQIQAVGAALLEGAAAFGRGLSGVKDGLNA